MARNSWNISAGIMKGGFYGAENLAVPHSGMKRVHQKLESIEIFLRETLVNFVGLCVTAY